MVTSAALDNSSLVFSGVNLWRLGSNRPVKTGPGFLLLMETTDLRLLVSSAVRECESLLQAVTVSKNVFSVNLILK